MMWSVSTSRDPVTKSEAQDSTIMASELTLFAKQISIFCQSSFWLPVVKIFSTRIQFVFRFHPNLNPGPSFSRWPLFFPIPPINTAFSAGMSRENQLSLNNIRFCEKFDWDSSSYILRSLYIFVSAPNECSRLLGKEGVANSMIRHFNGSAFCILHSAFCIFAWC
jgi:hypothetical protein